MHCKRVMLAAAAVFVNIRWAVGCRKCRCCVDVAVGGGQYGARAHGNWDGPWAVYDRLAGPDEGGTRSMCPAVHARAHAYATSAALYLSRGCARVSGLYLYSIDSRSVFNSNSIIIIIISLWLLRRYLYIQWHKHYSSTFPH